MSPAPPSAMVGTASASPPDNTGNAPLAATALTMSRPPVESLTATTSGRAASLHETPHVEHKTGGYAGQWAAGNGGAQRVAHGLLLATCRREQARRVAALHAAPVAPAPAGPCLASWQRLPSPCSARCLTRGRSASPSGKRSESGCCTRRWAAPPPPPPSRAGRARPAAACCSTGSPRGKRPRPLPWPSA